MATKKSTKSSETTPHDHDLARRIVRAAGITDDALTDAAKVDLNRLIAVDRQRVDDDPEAQPTDPRALWDANSAKQLRRWFGGRCITCAHWQPPESAEAQGQCAWLDASPNDLVTLPGPGVAKTAPTYGDILWTEIPAEDPETLQARTQLAMSLGLLQPFPATND